MPFDRDAGYLHDIADQISLIADFTAGLDLESFKADVKTVYAVVRALEIVSEASRRLSQPVKQRNSQIGWRDLATAGNIYRHEYGRLNPDLVWRALLEDIPTLKAVVEQELAKAGPPGPGTKDTTL